MPEAEDVITDAARHATVFARDLWRKHRKGASAPQVVALRDLAPRLDLLVSAVFGRSFALRVAQPPAPATFLTKLFRNAEGPRVNTALPSTDGVSVWLPGTLEHAPGMEPVDLYRTLALQQAMRAQRGSVNVWQTIGDPVTQAVYLVLESAMADRELANTLPGIRSALRTLRRQALSARPKASDFPRYRQPLERLVRTVLEEPLEQGASLTAIQVLDLARDRASCLGAEVAGRKATRLLYRDLWTGEMREQPDDQKVAASTQALDEEPNGSRPRSAKLGRTPRVREANEDEDDDRQGAWMVQTAQPHEQAEDPVGMQRPTDRDEATASEELADALSELPEARLVTTPGKPKEVLLSDEPPTSRAIRADKAAHASEQRLHYPEWDYRVRAYQEPGTTVWVRTADEGPQSWVDRTLHEHRATVRLVQRRFEMLKAQRMRLRKQMDGDDIDLDAYIEARSDYRAGLPMRVGLYVSYRQSRRNLAVLLLVDISGSTDGWVSTNKRVVDVEREALLLVAIALQGMGEPYGVQAFSGEGPHGVVVREVKGFDEPFDEQVARRIASLEPEHYTRAGAAIRHATSTLMKQHAQHRLLMLLSDGKPNDVDQYEGRYGVEDMRQAVTEAKLQGVSPFCLTVDRQAAAYLPSVFGTTHYATLQRPELLPTALLDWMRRLSSN